MHTTASPTTGSRTAGYVLCLLFLLPVAPVAALVALRVVISPVSAVGLGVLVVALCSGLVWLLRELDWHKDADS